MANGVGWGLLFIALGACGIVFVTVCWGLIDGWEARRDSRRRNARNQATRR